MNQTHFAFNFDDLTAEERIVYLLAAQRLLDQVDGKASPSIQPEISANGTPKT